MGLSRYVCKKLAEEGYTPKTIFKSSKTPEELLKKFTALCKMMSLESLKKE